ncbi:MAG: branched-chain amino acid ABC transporter permease [Acidimicrobiia bacterium]|nr:branched-chain amino acid ABC transporter permease [Acidimicrobiia bacterium]
MKTSYAHDLRLFPTAWKRIGLVLLLAVVVLVPLYVKDVFWLNLLVIAGIYAVAAIGLNLLTGYAGQVSLGTAFFIGLGGYTVVWFADPTRWGWPLWGWLPMAALIGALVGAAVGPIALRVRGQYLVIVTLGLVVVGQYLFRNTESVTGGNNATIEATHNLVAIGPVNFADLQLFGFVFKKEAGFVYLAWIVVLITALIAKNLVRTRPGRAIQAIRDRDVAAEVIGVSLVRYKIGAFAVSSAMAAVAGALLASYTRFISVDSLDIFLSIQFLAIIIVGGVGTIYGAVLGAVALQAIPEFINRFSDSLPYVATGTGESGISVASLNSAIFGILIIVFLIFFPHGLAALWERTKAFFQRWPYRT